MKITVIYKEDDFSNETNSDFIQTETRTFDNMVEWDGFQTMMGWQESEEQYDNSAEIVSVDIS